MSLSLSVRPERVAVGRDVSVPLWLAFVFSLAIIWALQWHDLDSALRVGLYSDSDDAMRMIEVRDFLAGQGWFDLHHHRVVTPGGFIMHWSRLIDAPLALLISGLNLFFEPAMAERWARIIWPALVQLVFLAGALACARRLNGPGAVFPAALLAGACPAIAYQFVPGRIDHHDVQITAAIWLAYFMIGAKRARRDAVIAGLICAFMIAIGFESLHLIAAACAVMAVRWIVNGEAARQPFTSFGVSLALGTAGFFLIGVGPAHWTNQVCDAIGFPILSFAVLTGASFLLLARLTARLPTGALRLGAAALVGLCALIALALAFPACRGGPYGAIPADVKAFWLDGIGEALAIDKLIALDPRAAFALLGAAIVGLAALAVLSLRKVEGRDSYLTLFALGSVSLAVTLYQIRGIGIFTTITLPGAASALYLLNERAKWRAWVAFPFFCSLPWALASLLLLPPPVEVATPASKACYAPDNYQHLAALPDGIVLTPFNIAAYVLVYSPLKVAGAPYHRDIAGLRFSHDVFTVPPDEARRLTRAWGVNYLISCLALRDMRDLAKEAPSGLAARMIAGNTPAWLKPLDEKGPIRVWRIDPETVSLN